MSLQQELKTAYGIDCPMAYHRIRSFKMERTNSSDMQIDVALDIWANKDARDTNKAPIGNKNYQILFNNGIAKPNNMMPLMPRIMMEEEPMEEEISEVRVDGEITTLPELYKAIKALFMPDAKDV